MTFTKTTPNTLSCSPEPPNKCLLNTEHNVWPLHGRCPVLAGYTRIRIWGVHFRCRLFKITQWRSVLVALNRTTNKNCGNSERQEWQTEGATSCYNQWKIGKKKGNFYKKPRSGRKQNFQRLYFFKHDSCLDFSWTLHTLAVFRLQVKSDWKQIPSKSWFLVSTVRLGFQQVSKCGDYRW